MGKSTLINTIFASHLMESKGRLLPEEVIRSTTEIHAVSHIIEENGVRLRLNIVDTPGYGDLINNDRCWDPIVKYIKDQHSAYLRKELTAQRERYIQDTRIHCCLFFIQPSGHSLKPIDIVVLKKLSDVVNVVPVIAKADSLTLEERQEFKARIKEEFAFHNLKMYPYDNDEFDEEEKNVNRQIKVGDAAGLVTGARTLTRSPEPHSLCRRWLREVHHCQRQAGPRPPEQVGRHQRRGREPLRVHLPQGFPAQDAPSGPHRDHLADPLRDLPRQAASGPEGEQRTGPRQQANQPGCRPRAEQELAADDHERLQLGMIRSWAARQPRTEADLSIAGARDGVTRDESRARSFPPLIEKVFRV